MTVPTYSELYEAVRPTLGQNLVEMLLLNSEGRDRLGGSFVLGFRAVCCDRVIVKEKRAREDCVSYGMR